MIAFVSPGSWAGGLRVTRAQLVPTRQWKGASRAQANYQKVTPFGLVKVKYMYIDTDMGVCPYTACPLDHYAPAQATSASACYPAPKVVFSLAMGGSVTAAEVNETVRSQLLTNIASSLGLDSGLLKITSVSDARRRLLAVSVEVEALAADKDTAAALQTRPAEVESAAQTAAAGAGLVVTGVTAVASLIPAATIQPGGGVGGGVDTPPPVISTATEVSGAVAASDSAAAPAPDADAATSSASVCSFSLLRLVVGWACSLGLHYVFSPGT